MKKTLSGKLMYFETIDTRCKVYTYIPLWALKMSFPAPRNDATKKNQSRDISV